MKNNKEIIINIRQCVKHKEYKKALSYCEFFKYVYPELSEIVKINIELINKRLAALEDSALKKSQELVMEIRVFNNREYTVECFEKIIENSPVDVKIDLINGTAEHSYLLAWYSLDDFGVSKSPHDESDIKKYIRTFFNKTLFFDSEFYINQYKPNLNGLDPLEHFVQYGYEEKKLPARWFDIYFEGDCKFIDHRKNAQSKQDNLSTTEPKVSVLVPVYNNSQYLHECLDSIINQHLKDLEIIIINDGSTDKKTIDILDDYAKKDSRIRLIHKKNTGYGHSMNCGLRAATGKYIGIVESDDYILENMYENLIHIAEKYTLDFIKSNFFVFYGSGVSRRLIERPLSGDKKHYGKIINPSENTSVFNMHNINTSGIFLKNFIDYNGIKFNETPGASFQDNGFWFQTFIFGKKIFILDNAFYCIRRDNDNSSVFNKDKVYCISDEYAYIRKILNKDFKMAEKFLPILNARKWSGYIFTLNRISNEHKKAFIAHIANEYRYALKNGELKKDVLGDNNFNLILQLLENPDCFLSNHLTKLSNNKQNRSIQNGKSIKISVILPVYNSELYLEDCLDSILRQTLSDIEIICVNDGSTDSSAKILQRYASTDSRMMVFKQENLGAGNARNKGLSIAQGKYLFFSDSDDFFEHNLLEKMYEKAELSKSDFCICLTDLNCMKTGAIKKCTYSLRNDICETVDNFDYTKINGNIFRAMMGWAFDKLYNRDFIISNKIQFQEIRIHNDMNFVFSALLHAAAISVVNEVLVHKRISLDGQISNSKRHYWRCFYDALMLLKQICNDIGVYNCVERSYINYALHIISRYNDALTDSIHYDEFRYFLKHKFCKSLDLLSKDEGYYWNKREYNSVVSLISYGDPDEK